MPSFRILRTDLGLDATRHIRDSLLVGRAAGNDVSINHPTVANSQCGIYWHDATYWLTNFAEAGTRLNGENITHSQLLPNDIVDIGAYRLFVKAHPTGMQLEVQQRSVDEVAFISAPRLSPSNEQEQTLDGYWRSLRSARELDVSTESWHPRAFRDVEVLSQVKLASRSVWMRLLFIVFALAGITALAWPRAFSPGPLSQAHQRLSSQAPTPHAREPMNKECLNCHSLRQSVQQNCASCHTTASFQAALSAKHEALKLQCITCHLEHQGTQASLTQTAQTACATCHQVTRGKATGLHGEPVAYPVNAFNVWSWNGLSVTVWRQRLLPNAPSDYTLREQFHLLHGEGRATGRTRCTDCHLAGTEPAQLKLNVRESCQQCHMLRPAFAATLARNPAAKQGTTQCFACHAQHGIERDVKSSTRRG